MVLVHAILALDFYPLEARGYGLVVVIVALGRVAWAGHSLVGHGSIGRGGEGEGQCGRGGEFLLSFVFSCFAL